MNYRSLANASAGRAYDARGPLHLVIDHAGALFNFKGAGEVAPGPVGAAPAIRTTAVLGSFIAIALGVWLFYRGVTSPKKLNLQTFGGLFLFGNGIGNLTQNLNPVRTAEAWATLAGGTFTPKT